MKTIFENELMREFIADFKHVFWQLIYENYPLFLTTHVLSDFMQLNIWII